MTNRLMGNIAKRSFKIPTGIKMAGYSDREKCNIGTYDELYTKAITIYNGKEKILIITNDLLSVDEEIVEKVVKRINEKCDIPEENIFICASHTHSGPDLCSWKLSDSLIKMDKKHRQLKDDIINTMAENAFCSIEQLVPVKIGFGEYECKEVASNRINKSLPSDYSVNVIKVIKDNNEVMAVLVNYTCHPTVMGADNLLISADYPGVMQDLIEKHFNNNCISMFINGACGDQSTRFTRKVQNFSEVERMGKLLYHSVLKALENIDSFEDWVDLKGCKEEIEFSKKELPEYSQALRIYEETKRLKELALKENKSPSDIRIAVTKHQGAAITLELIKYSKNDTKIIESIQLLRIGSMLIVGVPVELFVEYGLKIKRLSKFQNTIISGYTNNLLGYVYTPQSYEEGDYEAWSSPFEIYTGEFIVKKILNLITKMQ